MSRRIQRIGLVAAASGAPLRADLDFTALSAGAVTTLPGGLAFARSGDAYSVQDGESAIVQTFATNAARAGRPLAADPVGLVIEEARTQLLNRSSEFGTAPWNVYVTSLTAAAADGPDGSSLTADRIQPLSGGRGVYYFSLPALTNLVRYTYSQYQRGLAGGESYQLGWMNNSETHGSFKGGTLTTAWDRQQVSAIAGTDTNTILTPCFAAPMTGIAGNVGGKFGGIAAGARDGVVWGAQFEAGGFATEHIPTIADAPKARAGERLYHAAASDFASSGALKLEFQIKPKGASNRYSADAYLWKSGSDFARMEYTTGCIVISIGGVVYTTPIGMTWALGDAVDIYVEAGGGDPVYAAYRVNSGTRVLLSTGSPISLGTVDTTGAIDFLCNGTSGQFSSWIRRITAHV